MFDFEKISLTLSYSSVLFIVGIIISFLYAYYVYRFTLPPSSTSKRILLAFLRGSALILLLFVFFEPILSMTKKEVSEPVNLVFIDNSKSITINDGTDRENTIRQITDEIFNKAPGSNTELFTFGNSIEILNRDSKDQLNFNQTSTNFVQIFNEADPSKRNIASITIISDGVITDGSSPVYTARQKALPVFTVGVGDSSRKNDVEVKSVLYNDLIYAETPTTIMSTITNRGFGGQNVLVSLFEDDILLEQKSLTLEENGTNNISFNYTPEKSGEKKLSLTVSELKDEFTYANNKKIFFVNVLSNKIKVLIVGGSPSADYTFIKNTLLSDNNISVSTLTQIRPNQFIEDNYTNKIDSADIFFLIGFPTKDTPVEAFNRIVRKISDKNTPFFITINSEIDVAKISNIQQHLPFSVSQIDNIYQQVQPEIQNSENNNPLLRNNAENPIGAWNNLPPVLQPRAVINPKPESKVISRIKTENIPRPAPLIITRSLGSKRSVAIIAKEFWRWKLQTSTRRSDLFDSFILNSVRWLNVSDEYKKFKVTPVKKVFAIGENIEFSARVYDDAMNPVLNADVKLVATKNQEQFEINLRSAGNGLYEGNFQLRSPGDYSFKGEARINGNLLGEDSGIFNVGEIDIEMINPRMDYEFLNFLAMETGGEYFNADEIDMLIRELERITAKTVKEKFVTSEFSLWSSEWILLFIILIFGLEWFIRKRAGML